MEIKNYSVSELSDNELKSTDGGIWLLVGICVGIGIAWAIDKWG